MLGFSVIAVNEALDTIGSWIDDGQVYSSLKKMVEWGHAEEVENHGGYPNIYRVKYRKLDLLLRYGIMPKTLYGFRLDTRHSYEEDGSWVTITLWDQS